MSEPVRRGPGRPPFQPTDKDRATVRAMAAYGIPQDEIAAVIGCHDETLRIHFRQELDTAAPEFKGQIMQRLAAIALDQSGRWDDRAIITALIFLGKTRCGLRETLRHEGGDPERPVTLQIVSGVERDAAD